MARKIKNLNTKRATPQDDVPVKILKLNSYIFFQYLSQSFNESIEAVNFPNEWKYADITPVYKKIIDTKKRITDLLVLSVISKILERFPYDQIYKNIDNILSRHQKGYQKWYSSQHSLITMFEKWKKNLDKEGECGALFVDFSNAFDCLQHELSLMRMGSIINRLNSSRVF